MIKFPVTEELLKNKGVDYRLLGVLLLISIQEEDKIKIYKNNLITRPYLIELYNTEDISLSLNTMKRRIDGLKEAGILLEHKNCKNPFFEIVIANDRYIQIPNEHFQILLADFNSDAIKSYLYLRGKHNAQWEKAKKLYSFTLREVVESIGRSVGNGENTQLVKNHIDRMSDFGILGYVSFFTTLKSGLPSPRMRLLKF